MNFHFKQRSNAIAVSALLLIGALLFSGCHQRLAENVLSRPDWSPIASVEDPELDRFLAGYSLETVPAAQATSRPLRAPTMRRLVLQNSPEVISSRAELTAALAIQGSAGNWPDSELEGRVLTDEDGNSEMEGALMFGIPIGGHRAASGKAARQETELARIVFDEACKTAIRDLDAHLFELAWASERLTVHTDLASRSERFATMARQRQEAAVADPLDVALIIADAAQDKRAVVRSRQERETAERHLYLMLGIEPGAENVAPPALVSPQPQLARATVEQASKCRGSWLSAQAEYQRSEYEAVSRARQRVPDLMVGPVYAAAGSDKRYGVAAGISLPFFSGAGGRYKAALARRDAAYAALQIESRLTEVEINSAKSNLLSIAQELEALAGEPLTAAEEALTLAGERYSAGKVDILLLLSAHRSYSNLKLEILNLRLAAWNALLDLEKSVGCLLRGDGSH